MTQRVPDAPVASTPTLGLVRSTLRAHAAVDWVGWYREPGGTPVVRDRGAPDDGRAVWLKLETLEPTGHLTDRLVADAIAGARLGPDAEVLFARLDRFAISMLQATAPAGLSATVVIGNEPDELRLRELAMKLGARFRRVRAKDGENVEIKRAELVERHLAERANAHLLSVERVTAIRAGAALGHECAGQVDGALAAIVVPFAEGGALIEGLRQAVPGVKIVVAPLPDPNSRLLRDVQRDVGRQGVLLGPGGAAVVAMAREIACSDTVGDGDVVAVLPDGGHRHLGWWDGWGQRPVDNAGT